MSSRLLACLGVVCGAAFAPAAAHSLDLKTESLDEVREHVRRLEAWGFNGIVFLAQDGKVLLDEGIGLADREHGTPWSSTTVSTIGSITKQFTGAAILLLQERGQLAVQDSLPQYFADVPEDKRSITLHELLTHSSGIVDLDGAGDWDPIELDEFVRRILVQPLAFAPGSRYEYSNAGYSLLAAIIEQLSGSSYEAFVREHLFLPNGMRDTGYILADWGEGRMAQGYTAEGPWGTVLGRPMAADGPYWVLRGNGGIHSTAQDMLRWCMALLDGKVLQPESMQALWTPFVDEGGGETHYGYGWSIVNLGGVRVVTHNGGNGIFMADLAILPESRVVVFILTNVRALSDDAPRLLERIGGRLLAGQPLPDVPRVTARDSSEVEAVAGRYVFSDGQALVMDPTPRGLAVRAQGAEAFARLYSTGPFDSAGCARLTQRTREVVAAYVQGDFQPALDAYGGSARLERLQENYARRVETNEKAHGPSRGFEVLGSAQVGENRFTVVRFLYERGHEDLAYVWSSDEPARLLGASRRGLPAALEFLPSGGATFARWDGLFGVASRLRFRAGSGGTTEARLEPGDFAARRDGPGAGGGSRP